MLGGAGTLGRAVVGGLTAYGVDAEGASRRTGVDLATGRGLRAVLAGADAVVNAATDPLRPKRVDLAGTRRLVEAVRGTGVHVVHVSIVGCDANPYPYYRAKAACERALEAPGVSATVVRATQFHPFVATLSRAARPLGLALGMRGVAAQPCDVGWVAERVVEVAVGPCPDGLVRAADLAGPERVGLLEGVRLVAEHDGVRLRGTVTLPVLGGVARAFAAGTNLAGPGAVTGGSTFREWLDGQPVSGR